MTKQTGRRYETRLGCVSSKPVHDGVDSENDQNRRLLIFAFVSQLAGWTGAALFIPMIPLYLRHLKATDAEIGYYSAATLISLSLGPVLIGWLSDRWHVRDRLVVACYALQVPTAYCMGQTDSLVVACLLNVGLWTFGASSVNLARAIVALNYSASDRNSAFAKLAITSPIAFVVGGFAGGRIVEAWGYPVLFETAAVCWFLALVAGLGLKDRYVVEPVSEPETVAVSRPLILFCVAILLQSVAFQWSEIALPLRLNDLGFSLPFITSMYSVSSLVSIPFVILAGRHAHRIGNLNLLIGGVVVFAVSRFAISVFETEAQIIGAQIVTGVPAAFAHSIAAAIIANLGPERTVGSRMSLLMMSSGVGGAIGSAIGGHLLAAFEPAGLLVCAGFGLSAAAIFVRVFIVDPNTLTRERSPDV